MKKCPKCGAQIGEDARFCLFCMTSFEEKQEIKYKEEKNKRWLFLVAVLVLVLIIFVVFLLINNRGNEGSVTTTTSKDNSQALSTVGSENSSSEGKIAENSKEEGSFISSEVAESNFSSGSSQPQSSEPKNNVASVGGQKPLVNDSSTSTPKTSSNKEEEKSSSQKTTTTPSTSTSTTSTPSTAQNIEYSYRDAKYGDDFSVGANLENCVVITGVKNISQNGEYEIPSTLGGKKVIAIMGGAFCDDNIAASVKKVVVPASVKNIWSNAFRYCYNLTDIYFCGNSIYTEVNAFAKSSERNGRLTIHCSATCSDRNYRYYKNSASSYDADYKEWNG